MKNSTIPILAVFPVALPVSAQVTFDTVASSADFTDPRIDSRGDVAYISNTGGTTSAWRLPDGSSTPQLLAASSTSTSPFRGYRDFSSLADGADYRMVIETVRRLDLGEDGNAAFIADFVIEPEGEDFGSINTMIALSASLEMAPESTAAPRRRSLSIQKFSWGGLPFSQSVAPPPQGRLAPSSRHP